MKSQNGQSNYKKLCSVCVQDFQSVSGHFGTLSIKELSMEDFNAADFHKGGDITVKN